MAWSALASRVAFLTLLLARPHSAARSTADVVADALETERPREAMGARAEPRRSGKEVGNSPARWRFSRPQLPSFTGANPASLLEQLRSQEGELEQRVQEAVADIKSKAGDFGRQGSDMKFLSREEEEKISVRLMSELEFQQWERRERRHVAYSWGEAQEFLGRRFRSVGNSTPEETLSSLVQLEQGAGSSEQAAFWRRHREKFEAKARGWNTMKPNAMAQVCVQVDINLAFLYLPMVYISLGVMGGLIYDLRSHCWGWALEVSIGLSGGIAIGHSVRLGIGVSLVGTWNLNEIPFRDTGLQASDYKLPTQCSADQHSHLTKSGQKMCHTKNPFMLIWRGLRGILAQASNRIFPPERAKEMLAKKLHSFRKDARTQLEAQMQHWEDYKSIFLPPDATARDVPGTHVLAVSCLSVRYYFRPSFSVVFDGAAGNASHGMAVLGISIERAHVANVRKDSQAAIAGVLQGDVVEKVNGIQYVHGLVHELCLGAQSCEVGFKRARRANVMLNPEPARNLRCGIQVGNFRQGLPKTTRSRSSPHRRIITYSNHITRKSLAGQAFKNRHPGTHVGDTGYHESVWSGRERAAGNMLVDNHSNHVVHVASWELGASKTQRLEGVIEVDPSSVTQRQHLTVPLGCFRSRDFDPNQCIGEARLQIEPAVRRGRLSLKCVRVKNLVEEAGHAAEAFCKITMQKLAVLRWSNTWRTSSETLAAGQSVITWDEGTSFGIYSPATDDGPFPEAGPKGLAARVTVEAVEKEDAPKATPNAATETPKGTVQSELLGTAAFTWEELLGPEGFARPADSSARLVKKSGLSCGIDLEVVWTPEGAEGNLTSEPARGPGPLDTGKLAKASSGIFTAAAQLLGKFPKYSEQVLERLLDDPHTDAARGRAGVDCAVEPRSLLGSTRRRHCPLLYTDGRSGARMHRQMDAKSDSVYKEGEEARIVPDDRVMNLAKAVRVSSRRTDPEFWHGLLRSSANLFIRTVNDLQALFSVYFADEAQWDGLCRSLKPAFELPAENVDGTEKGSPMQWRYKPWSVSKAPQSEAEAAPANSANRLERGAHILTAGEEIPKYEEETFNPWADHWFAYGHGYNGEEAKTTALARIHFLTPDSPARGLHGNFYGEGDPAPTVVTHLWCELVGVQGRKALLDKNRTADPATTEEQRRRGRAKRDELLKSFVFGRRGAPRGAEGAGYEDLVEEVMGMFDKDRDASIKPEELTLSFDEACIDSSCGDISDCEKVRIRPAFAVLFPSLILTIRKYHQLLEARLTTARETMHYDRWPASEKMREVKKLTLQSLELLRRWLAELGACQPHDWAKEAAMRAAGEDPTVRKEMCFALRDQGGIISDTEELSALRELAQKEAKKLDTELAPQERCLAKGICYEKLTLLDNLAMDFHQAFAVQTRLPADLQHTAYAQSGFLLKGVLWDGLPAVRQALWEAVTDVDNDRDQDVFRRLERETEERVSTLASHLSPVAGWRLQFPLIETSFTLSLTLETATPGFCTPNAALLWITQAVHGATRSWQPGSQDMTRCTSAKVHPHNFAIFMNSCGVLKRGEGRSMKSKLKNTWWPSFSRKDRDVQVVMMAELLQFKPGSGMNSIFTSLDAQEKVLSSNFLAPASEAITALPAGQQHATNAAIAGLLSGPLFKTALALQEDFDPRLDVIMEEGSAGLVSAMKRIFDLMRGKAKESRKQPDAAVLNDPENGNEWVEAEDPKRPSGEPFGISEQDETRDFNDELDLRHFKPSWKCSSICGGRSVFVNTQRKGLFGTAPGAEVANNRRLSERLRADQCASCKWRDSECDEWEVLDSQSVVYGSLCCTIRPCEKAPFFPGGALPRCMRADLNKTAAPASAAPNETAAGAEALNDEPRISEGSVAPVADQEAPCCNTACGAKTFEDVGAEDGLCVRFQNQSFLGVNECGHCRWQAEDAPCQEDWGIQYMKGNMLLCCKKHTCLGGSQSGKPLASQGEPEEHSNEGSKPVVVRWERHPGCAATGVAMPSWWSRSSEDRIGGAKCGAVAFGTEAVDYAFSDPKFLFDAAGQPSKCAQCIWTERGMPCGEQWVSLQDGSVADRLEEQYSSTWSHRFRLCCIKLDCTPRHRDGGRQHAPASPAGLAQLRAGQEDASPTTHWVMHLSGTRHIRYFSGSTEVPPSVDDATKVKRTFWTWEAHVEGWNYFEFPKVDLGIASVAPVVALNLDWDLTEVVADAFNDVLNKTHQKRVQKCLECVQAGEAYCNQAYENPRYDPLEHEVCSAVNKPSALKCTQLVTYDDHGNPTSPRFIVNEEGCRGMGFRMVNEGYRRQYGAVTGLRNFRGYIHRLKAPLDEWGNSQDEEEGDEEDVTPSAVAAEREGSAEEDGDLTFSAGEENPS